MSSAEDCHLVADCTIGALTQAIGSVVYLRDAPGLVPVLGGMNGGRGRGIRRTTMICAARFTGDISTSGRLISETGMRSETVYLHLQGCLEAEWGHVDSLQSDIWTFRGRLVHV